MEPNIAIQLKEYELNLTKAGYSQEKIAEMVEAKRSELLNQQIQDELTGTQSNIKNNIRNQNNTAHSNMEEAVSNYHNAMKNYYVANDNFNKTKSEINSIYGYEVGKMKLEISDSSQLSQEEASLMASLYEKYGYTDLSKTRSNADTESSVAQLIAQMAVDTARRSDQTLSWT